MRKTTTAGILAVLVVFFAWSITGAFGQAVSGTLLGTVTDVSGGFIPGAAVTVRNQDTGVSRVVTTGSAGNYTVPNLAPGRYSVRVRYTGFETGVSTDNVVQVQQTTRADFKLKPGLVSQQVTVTGQTSLVESTTSDLGQVIGAKQIDSLPLNGRLFEQLVTLVPGTAQAGWGDFAENPSAAGSVTPTQAVVNGLPWSGNYYMVDGVHNTEPLNAFISITPPLDAIQEFKVETSDPSAEYGSFGGAIVNLVIKSGTNQLHGDVFDFLRNDALNARDFFAQSKSPYKSNQFGGAIGGPIIKNKLFFFGDYQQLSQHQGQTYLITVPTPLQRQGILTEGGQQPIYNPATGQLFPGQIIPTVDINPIAQKVANLFPLPNLPGIANNYVTNTVNTETVPQFDVKVDWEASSRDHIFGRESLAHRNFISPSPGNVFMMGGPYSNSQNQNGVLGWDRNISANKINEFRIGFNRYFTSDAANSYGIDENNALGLVNGNIPGLAYTSGIAQFNVPGFYNTGDPGWTNAVRIANIFEYSDNFVVIHGKHTIKFGTDIQRIQSTLTNAQDDPRGIFNFNANYTSNAGAAGTGNAFADFLLGYPSQVQRDFVNTRPGVRMTFAGFFAQDDYRITPKLTLNLGLRWDLFTSPVEAFNRQSNFDPNTGQIIMASGSNRSPNVDTYYGNWGPRIGLAYSPDNGKTAIRAAYGVSYFPDNFGATGGTLERNFPLFTITVLNAPTAFTPFYSLNQGLPAPITIATTPGQALAPPPGFGVFFISKNFRQDEAQVWNFSVERQLPYTMSFTAAYVGTHGTSLYRDLQLNQALPGPGPVGPRLPFYGVAPNIPTVDQRNGDGYSIYNSGQFELQKRTTFGLTLIASYTWSKTIDDTDTIVFPYLDNLNRGLANGFKDTDIPQNLVVSYNYNLPFGRGGRWLAGSSGVVGHLVSGWSASGISTFQSGAPLQVTVASSLLNNNGGGNPANLTCTHVSMTKTVHEWFNTGCFADPPAYTFGNSGVGHVFGPGINNWDFSLSKSTSLGSEQRQLKFEAGFFNLFNIPHFSNPSTTLDTSSFGTISSDRLNPRYIQFGLTLMF
ncbi:MAG: carboxypeptidase regulatory-like domain-containing protein [Terriglobia bacterium]